MHPPLPPSPFARQSPLQPYEWNGTNYWSAPGPTTPDRQVALVELRNVTQGIYVCANGGDCYDIIWQLVLTRPKDEPHAPWQTVTFSQMHMGFGGHADSPCAESLSPIEF